MGGPPVYEDGFFELTVVLTPLRIRWTIPLSLLHFREKCKVPVPWSPVEKPDGGGMRIFLAIFRHLSSAQ